MVGEGGEVFAGDLVGGGVVCRYLRGGAIDGGGELWIDRGEKGVRMG